MNVIKLKRKAVSGKHKYDVELHYKPDHKKLKGWVLKLVGTPGSWYMTTLLGVSNYSHGSVYCPEEKDRADGGDHYLSIHGDKWLWENPNYVLTEALRVLCKLDPTKEA